MCSMLVSLLHRLITTSPDSGVSEGVDVGVDVGEGVGPLLTASQYTLCADAVHALNSLALAGTSWYLVHHDTRAHDTF